MNQLVKKIAAYPGIGRFVVSIMLFWAGRKYQVRQFVVRSALCDAAIFTQASFAFHFTSKDALVVVAFATLLIAMKTFHTADGTSITGFSTFFLGIWCASFAPTIVEHILGIGPLQYAIGLGLAIIVLLSGTLLVFLAQDRIKDWMNGPGDVPPTQQ